MSILARILTRILNSPVFRFVALIIAAAVCALVGFAICMRFYYPGYRDHMEPLVASVSWLAVHGKPIYPDWTTGNAYGIIYGPLLFWVTGFFLLLSPTIFMSKVPAVLAYLGSFFVFAYALKKKGLDKVTAFLLVAVFMTALMPYYLAVFNGAPLPIESAAWMDLAYGGASEQNIAWMVNSCRIPFWILPKGAPFSMLNWYTHRPLFSDRFRQDFLTHYKLVAHGQFYYVWGCSRPS